MTVRAIAINVGANTGAPGFRGPVRPDGTFEYVPIPESEPTRERVPTYGDLDLATDIPEDVRGTPVHLDPEFPEYPTCRRYTYGDEHGVKAAPLSDLERGDVLFFYATLDPGTTSSTGRPGWQAPDWGAYLIGHFVIERVVTGEEYRTLPAEGRSAFANNAHVKREVFDARVLVQGDPDGSELYDRALPLSGRRAGTSPNRLVTELSSDSGKGPWWRRPLRFDGSATEEVLAIRDDRAPEQCFEGRSS